MNRNEFEDRERRWRQGNPQQQESRFSGGQQSAYGQQGYEQADRFTQQGTDRSYSMQSGYDDARRGYQEGHRAQPGMQSAYAPEGDWAGTGSYGNRGGWEQPRGFGGQERNSGYAFGHEGQRPGNDFNERSRYPRQFDEQDWSAQLGYRESQELSGQANGQLGDYAQRGVNRRGSGAQFGPPPRSGTERWGQPADRGSDFSNDFSYSSGSQGWREGNRRAQGYPGTDFYSGQGPSGGNQENPWAERSMRDSSSLWGTTGQWQGPHAGKGPRGYQRADERIREDACEMLAHHGDIDASEIDIEVRGGEVTLKGTVEDRWQKRMAEDLVERCSGVKDVRNELRVAHGQSSREGNSFTSQGAEMSTAPTGQTGGASQDMPATSGRANETATAPSR